MGKLKKSIEDNMKMGNHNSFIGSLGESMAASYLEEQGYEVLSRNYRCKQGEMDLIAIKNEDLHFIEVKTRTSNRYGRPCEAVDYKKLVRLEKIAGTYIKEQSPACRSYAFDVIEVIMNHIEGVI